MDKLRHLEGNPKHQRPRPNGSWQERHYGDMDYHE
jgi:hypothetical protein